MVLKPPPCVDCGKHKKERVVTVPSPDSGRPDPNALPTFVDAPSEAVDVDRGRNVGDESATRKGANGASG